MEQEVKLTPEEIYLFWQEVDKYNYLLKKIKGQEEYLNFIEKCKKELVWWNDALYYAKIYNLHCIFACDNFQVVHFIKPDNTILEIKGDEYTKLKSDITKKSFTGAGNTAIKQYGCLIIIIAILIGAFLAWID